MVLFFVRKNQTNGHSQRLLKRKNSVVVVVLLTFRRRKDKARDDDKIFFFFSLLIEMMIAVFISSSSPSFSLSVCENNRVRVFRVLLLSHSTVWDSSRPSLFFFGLSLQRKNMKKTLAFFFVFFFFASLSSSSRLSGHKKRESYPRLLHLYLTSKRSPYAHFHNT